MRGRAAAAAPSCTRSASAGTCARRRSARSPTRAGCACSTATSWSATCRSRRSSTTARSTTSSPSSRREPIYPAPPARLAPERGCRGDAARAAERALDRLEAVRVRAVRPDRRVAHRAPARRPPTPRCCRWRTTAAAGRSRSRSTATAAASPATPTPARSRRCSSAPRNLACVGAEPLGLTNCLNFGNPEKPHIAWQLTRAVEGLRDACLALGVPVVGGNVSLYNEGGGGPIYPTPIVGMVGELPDPARVPRVGFARGRPRGGAGRAVRARARGVGAGEAARAGWPSSLPALDLAAQADGAGGAARGGPRAASLRPCTTSPRAAWPSRSPSAASRAASARALDARRRRRGELFGEGPGGVVIAGPREAVEAVPGARVIGEVGGDALEVAGALGVPLARAARGLRGRHPGGLRLIGTLGGARSAAPVGTLRRSGSPAADGARDPALHLMTRVALDDRDGPRDECGVFGVYAPESDVARLAYFALYALQHRGQESAGIATAESGHIMTVRDLGLVVAGLRRGEAARAGGRDGDRPRALLDDRLVGVGERPAGRGAPTQRQVALAHNGNLINAVELHAELSEQGVAVPRHVRLGDHRRAALDPPGGAHRGRARRRDAAARGRLLDRRDDQGRGGRLPRPRRRCGRWRSASSATATAWPPRAAPSTSSAPSCCARSSRARWSRSARAGSRRASWSSPSARPSASSSTSTSPGPTRSSRATAPRCRGARWARSCSARRRSRPTS